MRKQITVSFQRSRTTNNNVRSVVVQGPFSQNCSSSSSQGQRWDQNIVSNLYLKTLHCLVKLQFLDSFL